MKPDAKLLAALERQNDYLRAIIALLAREKNGPTEVLLSEFGLGHQDIAKIMHKKPDAVRMLVKRRTQAKIDTTT